MSIDWLHFTPAASLMGGLLIGISAAGLFVLNGRIAGISGIVGGLFRPARGEFAWRIAFVAGLIVSATLYRLIAPLPVAHIDANWPSLIVAGLVVGFGTRLGSGCTSGHGVCGISRLSPRSLLATLVFMVSGFATVSIMRHLI